MRKVMEETRERVSRMNNAYCNKCERFHIMKNDFIEWTDDGVVAYECLMNDVKPDHADPWEGEGLA